MSSQVMRVSQPNRRSLAKVTLLAVLSTESVFFGMLLMVFLYMRSQQTSWPFMNTTLPELTLPIANTLLLLLSTVFARRAIQVIRRDDVKALNTALPITLIMGLVFVAGQVIEFNRSGMTITDTAFAGAFFILVAFHALHVLAGVVMLAINTVRSRLGDFSAGSYLPVEIGSWFWYYVAGVWLVLFFVLYII